MIAKMKETLAPTEAASVIVRGQYASTHSAVAVTSAYEAAYVRRWCEVAIRDLAAATSTF